MIKFKLFESILDIVTTLTIEKYWYFTLLMTFINWYVMHPLFFLSMMNVLHRNLRIFSLISSIKRMFHLFLIPVLEFLWNKQITRNWDKLRLAWDWAKSAISVSGVRQYFYFWNRGLANILQPGKQAYLVH